MSEFAEPRSQFRFTGRDWLHFSLAHAVASMLTANLMSIPTWLVFAAIVTSPQSIAASVMGFVLAGSIIQSCFEWIVLRRSLPQRKWFEWPCVNVLGAVLGLVLVAVVDVGARRIAFFDPTNQGIFNKVLMACAAGCAFSFTSGSIPTYWLGKATSASAWPYLIVRSAGGGLSTAMLAAMFANTAVLQQWPPVLIWLLLLVPIFLIGVLSGGLQGFGLWWMARLENRKEQ